MSQNVKNIRGQIDSVDNKILDLLMKRAELVIKIGQEKKKSNVQIIQPDREIVMIRRLLERHKGPLPKEAIVRIWRELVGAVSLLQTGLKVCVNVPDDSSGLIYWDMAKDYFSSVLPMQKVSNPLGAMAMVREQEATFAVVPWPQDEESNPWWSYLLEESGDTGMRVVARLPLGDRTEQEPNLEYRALVIARLRFDPSGDDRSFIGFELEEDISRGKIIDTIKSLGHEALSLYSCPGNSQGRKFHLLELDSFMDSENELHRKALDLLEDSKGKCICIGGYPVPPVFNDKVGKSACSEKFESPKKKTA